jgi:hypothetical protein
MAARLSATRLPATATASTNGPGRYGAAHQRGEPARRDVLAMTKASLSALRRSPRCRTGVRSQERMNPANRANGRYSHRDVAPSLSSLSASQPAAARGEQPWTRPN